MEDSNADLSQNCQEYLTPDKVMLTEFIEKYKSCRELWDRGHEYYTNKHVRQKSLQKLVDVYKKWKPDADIYDVRRKINCIRCCYKRISKRLENSKKLGLDAGSESFTFKLLDFLAETEDLQSKDEKDKNTDVSEAEENENEEPNETCEGQSDEDVQDSAENVPDTDDKSLTCDNVAMAAFIKLYENSPELWDPANPAYYNRHAKNKALDKLANILKSLKPDATIDDAKKKINSLRSNYRKDLKRVEEAKERGYVLQTSWKFRALTFLKNKLFDKSKDFQNADRDEGNSTFRESSPGDEFEEECYAENENHDLSSENSFDVGNNEVADVTEKKLKFINAFKSHPVLWNPKHPGYTDKFEREIALRKLLKVYKLLKPNATRRDVIRNINGLRSNFRRQFKRSVANRQSGESRKSSWFKSLSFLLEVEKAAMIRENALHTRSASESSKGNPLKMMKTEEKRSIEINHRPHHFDSQSIQYSSGVDTLAVLWCRKLKKLDRKQRIYAEKFINDILFEAQLNNLHKNSVIINTVDCLHPTRAVAMELSYERPDNYVKLKGSDDDADSSDDDVLS